MTRPAFFKIILKLLPNLHQKLTLHIKGYPDFPTLTLVTLAEYGSGLPSLDRGQGLPVSSCHSSSPSPHFVFVFVFVSRSLAGSFVVIYLHFNAFVFFCIYTLPAAAHLLLIPFVAT